MFKGLLVVAVATLAFGSAQAQKKNAGIINNGAEKGYGMAGCGLGSVVFGPKRGLFKLLELLSTELHGIRRSGLHLVL